MIRLLANCNSSGCKKFNTLFNFAKVDLFRLKGSIMHPKLLGYLKTAKTEGTYC